MQPEFGIYQAVVTDNSQFFINGRIKVRVQNMYNGKINWNLTDNFNYNEFLKEMMDDIWAYVYTPMGGGSNHGMFALPQINSVGLVQFMNGNIKKPIWMGSFFRPEYDEQRKLARVNVPNDNKFLEGSGADGITQNQGGVGEKRIEGGFGTLILRTKTTRPPTQNEPERMDFNERKSENLIVLSEDKVSVTHFDEWKDNKLKGYQELELGTYEQRDANGNVVDSYPETNMSVVENKGDSDEKISKIKLNKNGTYLEAGEGNYKNTVECEGNDVKLTSTNTERSDETTTITLTSKNISLNNNKVNIFIENNEVSISAYDGDIRLSGKQVLLGDGGGYVVVSDVPGFSMRLEDGSVIKASSKTRA